MNGTFVIEEKFLDQETKDLFFDLERLTSELGEKVTADKFAADVLNGTENLEDLKLLRHLLQKEKEYPTERMLAERNYVTSEELGKKLGFI
jgi:hypothetical protein